MDQRKKISVDVVLDLLEFSVHAKPESKFVNSIQEQYNQRGWLSKKQLEGLFQMATKLPDAPASKLATLNAIILKMPSKSKSELPEPTPLFKKNDELGNMINLMLGKVPQHKGVLFLKSKWENNEVITASEITELKKLMLWFQKQNL